VATSVDTEQISAVQSNNNT